MNRAGWLLLGKVCGLPVTAVSNLHSAVPTDQQWTCPLYTRERTCAALAHVRLGPEAEIGILFDYLIRSTDQRVGDVEAESLGSLEVDGQLDLGYLLDR